MINLKSLVRRKYLFGSLSSFDKINFQISKNLPNRSFYNSSKRFLYNKKDDFEELGKYFLTLEKKNKAISDKLKEFEKNIEFFIREASAGKKEHKPMRV